MKRGRINNGVDVEEEVSKNRKINSDNDIQVERFGEDHNVASSNLEPYANDFENLQNELQRIDEDCAKEQIQIQKTFDQKKRPLFDKRQKIIEKIPNFWGRTLRMHRALISMAREDEPILKHLQKIDLDDNLDDNGSYKVTFVFDEEASRYMSPLTLVKHVKFSGEHTEEEIVEATPIKWKDTVDGKRYINPVDAVNSRRDLGNEVVHGDEPWSIFEWFSKEPWTDHPDVGEVIRREIWHSPLIYYLEQEFPDEEDVEDDDDDDDGAEDVDEGDEEEVDDSEE